MEFDHETEMEKIVDSLQKTNQATIKGLGTIEIIGLDGVEHLIAETLDKKLSLSCKIIDNLTMYLAVRILIASLQDAQHNTEYYLKCTE